MRARGGGADAADPGGRAELLKVVEFDHFTNWMSSYYAIDFLAIWEQVNNPSFNRVGLHTVKLRYQAAARRSSRARTSS